MKTICVTGAVGTGKTELSKKLAKHLKFEYLDVSKLKNKLSEGYDKEKKCEIIDIKKLNKFLIEKIKSSGNIIIDSHMSHYLPKKYVDLCIVTKCEIKVLKNRLKKRNYSLSKIKDNIEAEIFDVCLLEAKKRKHEILVVDTTKGYKIKEIIDYIKNE